MALGAVPGFGYPDGVLVGRVLGDDVAEAAGHALNAITQDVDQRAALPGGGDHLADESVHSVSLLYRVAAGQQGPARPPDERESLRIPSPRPAAERRDPRPGAI